MIRVWYNLDSSVGRAAVSESRGSRPGGFNSSRNHWCGGFTRFFLWMKTKGSPLARGIILGLDCTGEGNWLYLSVSGRRQSHLMVATSVAGLYGGATRNAMTLIGCDCANHADKNWGRKNPERNRQLTTTTTEFVRCRFMPCFLLFLAYLNLATACLLWRPIVAHCQRVSCRAFEQALLCISLVSEITTHPSHYHGKCLYCGHQLPIRLCFVCVFCYFS